MNSFRIIMNIRLRLRPSSLLLGPPPPRPLMLMTTTMTMVVMALMIGRVQRMTMRLPQVNSEALKLLGFD